VGAKHQKNQTESEYLKLNKKILGGVVIIAILVISLSVVFGTGYDKPHRTITITGSTTVLPIAQRCAEEWTSTRNPSRTHPYYDEVNVAGGGSGVGIADLIQGNNDIADASRPMKDSEIAQAQASGINPVKHKIALDGVSIIVHPTNPVTGLTMEKIKDIYTGAITNWNQVGGPDATIVVYNRESTSGTYETFETKVMQSEPIRADALEKTSNGAMKEAVANDPNGIAYVGLGYVDSSVKAVTVNGIVASAETVRNGKYPIARYLFMITNGELSGQTNTLVADFINFVLSTEGQSLVEDVGFIALS
jgi:phosphate transport system substrate-binding protein